ncbi:hypothetical protein [Rhizobium phage RHEph18]|uniref:hypothetical protein n=1 Tax=Rhizobium TaxID=379 RepID=UPI0007EA963A|nr:MULTISPECIES: hypothetical protein [Rhizobium]ANL02703.1 hypothetical protein AMJ99_CH01116 [Rhizobium esperanzae]ANM33555.1 hypothetical protein AMK04_CH01117 [Rhizobium sp. N871]QIG73705.1 hypothetical protein EVC05_013 [Rhizobium phage RHph_N2]QXV74423.1 hypothetical protein [Rhizobium phage RHEph18]
MALSFLFGGDTQETPDSIKRKRDLVRAIMGASNAPRNIGEGLNALGDGIVANVLDRRADAAEKTGTDAANSLFNSIMGTPSTPGATGSAMPAVSSSGNVPVASSQPGEVYTPFIDTVKTGFDPGTGQKLAVTNPYGLAAVAATGQAESGFSPKNAGRVWNDGANNAGGIMSWNGPRLANLQRFAGGTNGTPQQQAQFFLQENPDLVAKLNNAKSVEEAQQLMNNAWAFKGYNQPGNPNAAHRLSLANSFLPKFQGQGGGTEVASLDASAGMPSPGPIAPPPVNQPPPAPTPGYVDPKVVNVGRAPMQGPPRPAPELPPPTTIANAPAVAAQPSVAPPAPAAPPQQVAQNTQQPFAGVDPRLLQALSNPFLNPGQRAAIQMLIQQQERQVEQQQEEQTWRAREDYKMNSQKADPAYQLDQDYKRAQLEALKNKTGKTNLINAGEGNIYDPDTQTWIKAPSAQGQSGEGFRFGGNSVEAQALNGLIESKQLTVDQAQQLAAGKTISGPNGELLFLTPQGIFKQDGQSPTQPAQPQQSGPVDLFGDGGQPVTAAAPQGQQAPAQPQNDQIIPLTAPKAPSNEQLNAAGFADRMHSAGGLLDKYEQQGLNATDQFLTGSPFIPGFIGNSIVGKTNPDYQLFDQARRDFINAQLRRESGAVIGPDEFNNANKQYFPQPGDSKAVIEQKREARRLAIESMARSAGPNYKRPVPTGNDADIQAARDAIAKGAPRDKVIKRLQDAGIDTTGL